MKEAIELERKPRRAPILVLGLIALVGVGAVGFTAFRRSVVYYKTPTEVLALPGQQVRVSGKVVPGSLEFSTGRGGVDFRLTDGKTTIPVSYSGVVPDTLKDDAEAVAEGSLGPDGTFVAKNLLAKCPSKFEGKTGPAAGGSG